MVLTSVCVGGVDKCTVPEICVFQLHRDVSRRISRKWVFSETRANSLRVASFSDNVPRRGEFEPIWGYVYMYVHVWTRPEKRYVEKRQGMFEIVLKYYLSNYSRANGHAQAGF